MSLLSCPVKGQSVVARRSRLYAQPGRSTGVRCQRTDVANRPSTAPEGGEPRRNGCFDEAGGANAQLHLYPAPFRPYSSSTNPVTSFEAGPQHPTGLSLGNRTPWLKCRLRVAINICPPGSTVKRFRQDARKSLLRKVIFHLSSRMRSPAKDRYEDSEGTQNPWQGSRSPSLEEPGSLPRDSKSLTRGAWVSTEGLESPNERSRGLYRGTRSL
jgi:hypothetical protein